MSPAACCLPSEQRSRTSGDSSRSRATFRRARRASKRTITLAHGGNTLDRGASLGHRWGVSAFITGTDTGVGKTYVTRLIIETLRAEGIDVRPASEAGIMARR